MYVVSDLTSKFKTKSYTDKLSDTGGWIHLPSLPLFYFLFFAGAINVILAILSFGSFGDQFNIENTFHKDFNWSSFYSPQLFTFLTEFISFIPFSVFFLLKILNNKNFDSSLNKDSVIKEHEIQFSRSILAFFKELVVLTSLFVSPLLIISSVATNNYGFYQISDLSAPSYPNTWYNSILLVRIYLFIFFVGILSIVSIVSLFIGLNENKLIIHQKIKTIAHLDIKNNNQEFISIVEETSSNKYSYNAYIELKNFDFENKSEKLKLSFAAKLDRLIYQEELVDSNNSRQATLIKVSIPFLREQKRDHTNSKKGFKPNLIDNPYLNLTNFSKSFEKKFVNRVFIKISQNTSAFNEKDQSKFIDKISQLVKTLNEQVIIATLCNPSLIAKIHLYLKRNNLFNSRTEDHNLDEYDQSNKDSILEKRIIKDFETIEYFYNEILFNVKIQNEINSLNKDQLMDFLYSKMPFWSPEENFNQFKNQKNNDLYFEWFSKDAITKKIEINSNRNFTTILIEHLNQIFGGFLKQELSFYNQDSTCIKVENSWNNFFSTFKTSFDKNGKHETLNLKVNSYQDIDSAISIYKMTDTSVSLKSGFLYNMIKESDTDTVIVPFVRKNYSLNVQRKFVINRFSRFLNSKESEFNRNYSKDQLSKLAEDAFQEVFSSGSRLATFSVFVLKKFDNISEANRNKRPINLVYKPSAFSIGIRLERTDDEQFVHLSHLLKHHQWDDDHYQPYYNDRFVCNFNTLSSMGFFTVQNEVDDSSSGSIYFGSNYDDKDGNDVWINMGRYRDKKVSNVPSSNGHMVIIGKSGSGKTYLAQSLVFQKAKNMRVFIFDIENEYHDIFRLLALKSYPQLATQSIDLMENSSNINPFEIQVSTDEKLKIDHFNQTFIKSDNSASMIFNETFGKQKLSYIMIYQRHKTFLLRFLKTLFKYEANDFDVEWLTMIEEVYKAKLIKEFGDIKNILEDDTYIKKIINQPHSSPTMINLFEVINQKSNNYNITDYSTSQKTLASVDYRQDLYSFYFNLKEKVKELDKDSFFKSKFCQPTTINLDKDFIRFDVSSLLTSTSLNHYSQLSLMLILNYLTISIFMKEITNISSDKNTLENKGIFVLIDETHRYLRKELIDMVDFMTALAKQGRKRYAEMCIISQNISDFYRQSDSKDVVQKAQDVVKNCGYKFIMQLAQDYDIVKDFISSSFEITEKDDNFIRSLTKGIGYLVQGPLEQIGINVKRLETHQQYEEALKRISHVFIELKSRFEIKDIFTKIKEKNMKEENMNKKEYEDELKHILNLLNQLYQNNKDPLKGEITNILTKIKEENMNKKEYEKDLNHISSIFNKDPLKDEIIDILTKIEEANMDKQYVVNKININEKTKGKQDQKFENFYEHILLTLSPNNKIKG